MKHRTQADKLATASKAIVTAERALFDSRINFGCTNEWYQECSEIERQLDALLTRVTRLAGISGSNKGEYNG